MIVRQQSRRSFRRRLHLYSRRPAIRLVCNCTNSSTDIPRTSLPAPASVPAGPRAPTAAPFVVIGTSRRTVIVKAAAAGTGTTRLSNHLTRTTVRWFASMASATSFYDFKPLDKRGSEVALADYKGKVVLVVNTASKCGFTPQYAGLEKLYKGIKAKYGDDFVILGFPCNQFGGQEPENDEGIQTFCQINYGVTFPIMKKTDVNGDKAEPLFEWLKSEKPGIMGLKRVKWNFEKFLVGRDGAVKGRWASTTKPDQLEKPILDELQATKA